MTYWKHHLLTKQFAGPAVLAAVCLSLYRLARRSLPRPNATSKTGLGGAGTEVTPYPPDSFPGARDVETSYGTIKVFEWGPEDGEKVLLVHGMTMPSIALGDMACEMVRKGCRVMMFDLFGRGHTDAPLDLPCDERLYTTQILLVLASSPLPWTGTAAFHLLGYSLGGALVTAFAAYHHAMLRSITGVGPAGLMPPVKLGPRHRLAIRCQGWLPDWLLEALVRKEMEFDMNVEGPPTVSHGSTPWEMVPVSAENVFPRVRDVINWQLRANKSYVRAYISTYRHTPVWGQLDGAWKLLGEKMAQNRRRGHGLKKMCIVLGDVDAFLPTDKSVRDATAALGKDGVDITILEGAHSIALTRGAEIAQIVMKAWQGGGGV